MFRLWCGAVPLVALLWIFLTNPARAELILDQSNVGSSPTFDAAIVPPQSWAQTFTVGVEGTLARIDLQIYKHTGATEDLLFMVRSTTGGVPNPDDAQSLFGMVIPLSAIPTFDSPFMMVPLTSLDVSAAQIAVAPGDVLAISLSRAGLGGPPWALWRQTLPVYDRGDPFYRLGTSGPWSRQPGYDSGFQTYVSAIPEPSSLSLCLLGGICLCYLGRTKSAEATVKTG
jgi:hypothetical protein